MSCPVQKRYGDLLGCYILHEVVLLLGILPLDQCIDCIHVHLREVFLVLSDAKLLAPVMFDHLIRRHCADGIE